MLLLKSEGWVRGVQDSPEAAALGVSVGNKMILRNLACVLLKDPIPDKT